MPATVISPAESQPERTNYAMAIAETLAPVISAVGGG
jgi:hypothetical protein